MCGVWRVSGVDSRRRRGEWKAEQSKALGGGNLSERGRRARSASGPVLRQEPEQEPDAEGVQTMTGR